MRIVLYGVYAAVLAVVSIFTGEIVTFIMLGMILLALDNMNRTLRRIGDRLDRLDRNSNDS